MYEEIVEFILNEATKEQILELHYLTFEKAFKLE